MLQPRSFFTESLTRDDVVGGLGGASTVVCRCVRCPGFVRKECQWAIYRSFAGAKERVNILSVGVLE
jgi:hypothetical protein